MKTKFNIALIGGRGYVGQEIIHILNQHPNFILCKAFSRTAAEKEVDGYNQHPSLRYSLLEDSNLDLDNIDIAILALSNGDSNKYVTEIDLKYPDMTLIDISSDHRFNPKWQYRLPDISRVKATKKISNPGCYASAIQFSIEPIKNLISGRVSCFGVSGYSGAGASPNEKNNKVNLQDNVIPYSLQGHIHEQEVKKYCYKRSIF
jgi:N-acetyl-gamma-glutamylphosphate reductase